MGADIKIENKRLSCQEPVGSVQVKYNGRLNSGKIEAKDVATGIDELPILALAGAFCQGEFLVKGAGELRNKESDRLSLLVENLKNAGATIEQLNDDFYVQGKERIKGGSLWRTGGDHRLAMTGLIANLLFDEAVEIDDIKCIDISYPGYQAELATILK